MRRAIETAPKDGKPIILEDDAAGTFELSRWSTKQRAWVGKDGKPISIIPAHWLPLQHDPWLESEEQLSQKETERDRSDHPEIQRTPSLADQPALECLPAREGAPKQDNVPVSVIAPTPPAAGTPAGSWPPKSDEQLSPREEEWRGLTDPQIPPIRPSSARAALERLAQEVAFEPPNSVTLPVIEPQTVTSQPGPVAWNRLTEANKNLPKNEVEWRSLPDPLIQPILPLSSGRAALERLAQKVDLAPPSNFIVPVIEPQTPQQDVAFPVIEPRITACGPRPPAWRRHAIFSIAAAIIASSLIVIYLHASIATYVTQYIDQRDVERLDRIGQHSSQNAISLPIQWLGGLLSRASIVQQQDKTNGSDEQTAIEDAVNTTTASQAPKFLEKRSDSDVGEKEPGQLEPALERRDVGLRDSSPTASQSQPLHTEKITALLQDLAAAQERMTENEVRYGKALAEERERSAALASELATTKRIVETEALRSNKTANDSVQLKLVADAAASKLQRERERADALTSELEKMRRQVEATADEASQLKRSPEIGTAELQQSDAVTSPLLPRYAQARQSMGWSVYRGKGGAVVDVPLGIFVQDAGPTAKGIGRRFKSADGRSELAAYSFQEPGQTPESYLRNNLAVDPATISYKRVTKRFFALSSENSNRIYYSRCNFYDAIHCIYLEYPQSEKIAWDAIVTRISRSLHGGS